MFDDTDGHKSIRMAHEPECPWIDPIHHADGSVTAAACICDRLRAHGAAEYQRGRSDAAAAVEALEHWASHSPDGGVWACYASDPVAAARGEKA